MKIRGGFALVFSVLMILALALLSLGILTLGTREAALSRTLEAVVHARALAESAALVELAAWSTERWDGLDLSAEAPGMATWPGAATVVERLDTGLFVVRSRSNLPGGARPAAVGRAAVLVQALPASRLAVAFPATVTSDSTGAVVVAGGRTTGDEPLVRAGAAPPPLDLSDVTGLSGIASQTVAPGVVTPGPVSVAGECVRGALNWGAISPVHPCHDLWPVIHAPGDLSLAGGEVRGVLVVEGNLVLEGDVRIEGVVRVLGRMSMRDGLVAGAVRAGRVELLGGEVRGDAALVIEALSAPALDRGFRPANRWWVPSF